jgi:hypothetical protein
MQEQITSPAPVPVLRLELAPSALRLRPLAADETAFDHEGFRASLRARWPKLTVANIARKIGVSDAGLRQVLDGKREPSLHFYHRLCVGLDAPLGSWWRGVQLHAGQS